jgi:hypothetical protein
VTNSLTYLTVCCLLIGSVLSPACHSEKTNPAGIDDENCPAGQWSADTGGGYAYTHDCHPYYGVHFSIYSDGSSWDAKQQLADLAEEIFDELVVEFLIQSIEEDLQFIDNYRYYIYAQKHIEDIKAMGYRNGFFIGAIDCATIPWYYTSNPFRYRCLTRHELTHVFQFTLTGCPSNSACPYWLGVWFREGQAVYMSGLGENARVTTLDEFYQWYGNENHINPISIHRWVNFPDPDRGGEFYPMFGLAYAYLVDTEHGHGATISDMRELFQLMKEGDGFEEAFLKALDISVPWFEENFYNLMEEYLSESDGETSRNLKDKMDYFIEMQEAIL